MKNHLPAFLLGMLAATLVAGLTVTALAASGQMTITVDPINIQVNGETFQPKDANGNDVAVFAYNGTTYAPLRALAEAYGLEVGYDPETNMATVKEPEGGEENPGEAEPNVPVYNWSEEEEAAYQEFKGMWEILLVQEDTFFSYRARYIGDKQLEDWREWLASYGEETLDKFASRLALETLNGKNGSLGFRYDDMNPSVFGIQSMNGVITKIVDSIFHNGLIYPEEPIDLT